MDKEALLRKLQATPKAHLVKGYALLLEVHSDAGLAVIRSARRWLKRWGAELDAAGINLSREERALKRAVERLERRNKK